MRGVRTCLRLDRDIGGGDLVRCCLIVDDRDYG